jgi:hypothetical protein
MKTLLIAAVAGIALGALGGPAIVLIPWAIAGLTIGYMSADWRQAAASGGLFGFLVAFCFMVAGYNGSESLVSRVPFFALLGIFGAICGIAWALLGRLIGRRFQRQKI